MVITFNYKEGTKTITFAELQEAISNKNGSDLDCLAAPKFSQPRVGLGEFCLLVRLEQDGGPQAAKNSPVDCFLVRGRVRS